MRKIDGLLNEHKKKVLKRLSLSPALQVLGGPGLEVSGAQRSDMRGRVHVSHGGGPQSIRPGRGQQSEGLGSARGDVEGETVRRGRGSLVPSSPAGPVKGSQGGVDGSLGRSEWGIGKTQKSVVMECQFGDRR